MQQPSQKFRLGRKKTTRGHLAEAVRLESIGDSEGARVSLEKAKALSAGEFQTLRLLAIHHLKQYFGS